MSKDNCEVCVGRCKCYDEEGLCSHCGNFPVNPGSDFCIHCFLRLTYPEPRKVEAIANMEAGLTWTCIECGALNNPRAHICRHCRY